MSDASENSTPRPEDDRAARIRKLADECLQRWGSGDSISIESVLAAHQDLLPELRAELQKVCVIAQAADGTLTEERPAAAAEQDVESTSGHLPGCLHMHCPHCHNPVEVLAESPLTDIICKGCGSTFSLVDRSEESRESAPLETVGHFEIVSRLGVGAFGTVWKAHDTQLDRTVAVKIPRVRHLNALQEEQFFREARVAAQLRHPNIVSVHEVGRHGDSLYIVSDLVRGVSLSDWLTARRPTYQETAQLCAKIADALHHAHEQGVVHRDLKPSNIMLDDTGEPYIMDFGLAKRDAGEITMTVDGQVLGSPLYMSPEQAEGKAHEADRRSDVYSLGVILYELLTGEHLFPGNIRMILHQVIHDDPPSPRKLNRSVPRDLETICLKAIEKSPDRRFATARDVADELRRFLRSEPIRSRPISHLARGWRWCKRNTKVASLIAIVLTLLAVLPSYIVTETYLGKGRAEHVRCEVYNHQLASVSDVWKNDACRALEMLDDNERCPQYLRDFTWGFLRRLSRREQLTFAGHTRPVSSLSFSPDGTILASGGYDNTVRLWDVVTGCQITVLGAHASAVNSVAFSPNGQTLASAGDDQTIRLRSMETFEQLTELAGESGGMHSLVFSPDGEKLASSDEAGALRVWASKTGQVLLTLKGLTGAPSPLAFSPDGKALAFVGEKGKIRLWDMEIGKQRDSFATASGAVALRFFPDGRKLLVGDSGRIRVLDADTGQELNVREGMYLGFALDVSPDGKTVATAPVGTGASRGGVALWDTLNNQQITLGGHRQVVTFVRFSPDGKTVASASRDMKIKLWNVEAVDEWTSLPGTVDSGEVNCVAFSRTGGMLACAVRHNPSSHLLLWDLETGDDPRGFAGHAGLVHRVTFSPVDDRFAVAGANGMVGIWDGKAGVQLSTLEGHERPVFSVAFSADGEVLASGSSDKTVRLWDVAKGLTKYTLTGHSGTVSSVAFSPDGKTLASAGHDGTVMLWEMGTGQQRATLRGHKERVNSVFFSADGEMLASAGDDKSVRVWNVAANGELAATMDHPDRVTCVVFSPDGKTLVSAGGDADQTLGFENGPTARVTGCAIDHD